MATGRENLFDAVLVKDLMNKVKRKIIFSGFIGTDADPIQRTERIYFLNGQ